MDFPRFGCKCDCNGFRFQFRLQTKWHCTMQDFTHCRESDSDSNPNSPAQECECEHFPMTISEWIHSGFRTKTRRHQKSKNSVAPQKDWCSPKLFLKLESIPVGCVLPSFLIPRGGFPTKIPSPDRAPLEGTWDQVARKWHHKETTVDRQTAQKTLSQNFVCGCLKLWDG